jgi:hypothetical protein
MRRTPRQSDQIGQRDVGTLWTLLRRDRTARCALMAWPEAWEIRVLIDGAVLLSERCDRAHEAFELAERWKNRMLERGWRAVVPRSGSRTQPAP